MHGPRAATAQHARFDVANGVGDRDLAKEMAKLHSTGWDTLLKAKSLDRIGESPSAAFITDAEFFRLIRGDCPRGSM